jgi:hypothetical protein
MAITKTIQIDVDEQKAVGGLQNLDKSFQESEKQTDSLKKQLREATQELIRAQEEFGDYSKAALDAAKKVAGLKDQIQEAKETSQLFDPGAKFQAATGAIAAGANAVQGYQAALGLLGVEGEAVQQTLLKVQSAMALSQSLSGIADSAKDFQRLGAVAKQALSGIRAGIAATGIGVLVVALGAIVAYWDDIKEAVNGVSSEQKELNALAEKDLQAQQSKLDSIGGQENILKLQGKSEKDILKLKIAQTDEVIKATENQIAQNDITAKAQIKAAQRNKEILTGIIKFIQTPLILLLEGVDSIGKALGQNFELAKGFNDLIDKGVSLIFDPEGEAKKAEETRKESLKGLEKLKNDRAGLQLAVQNIDKQAAKDAKAKQDERNKKEQEELQKQKDALKSIEENALKSIEDLKAKTETDKVALQKQRDLAELDAVKLSEEEKAKARLAILDKYKILEAEAKIKDDEAKKKEEDERLAKEQEALIKSLELKSEFDNLTFEQQRALLTERENTLLNDKTLSEEQRNALEKQFSDARKTIAEKEADAKLSIQNAVLDNIAGGIGVLKQLGEKNKALQKAAIIAENAAGIARIIINTKAANAKAIATSPLTAGQPWVTINTISGALGVAGSILATKKALSELGGGSVSGGSVGASPSGTSGATTAPTFNVVGDGGVNQIQNTLGAQQPVQAYVVANNVTTAQSLDRNIIQNASL